MPEVNKMESFSRILLCELTEYYFESFFDSSLNSNDTIINKEEERN